MQLYFYLLSPVLHLLEAPFIKTGGSTGEKFVSAPTQEEGNYYINHEKKPKPKKRRRQTRIRRYRRETRNKIRKNDGVIKGGRCMQLESDNACMLTNC
jgi:hypothetical protein